MIEVRIQNYQDLINISSSPSIISGRKLLLNLFNEAIAAVDPFLILRKKLHFNPRMKTIEINNSIFKLSNKKIWIIGAGKAVGRMAEALEDLLRDYDIEGIICVPEGVKNALNLSQIKVRESSHPIPMEKNVKNTQETLNLMKNIKSEDFVIGLISGGGSALWIAPIKPIPIEEIQDLNNQLLKSGMPIHEINVIRKHLSQIKGGKMANLIPGRGFVLVLSDVIGDRLESIASGPFYPDNSTYRNVINLAKKYKLKIEKRLPHVNQVIKEGIKAEKKVVELKKMPDGEKLKHYLIGSNRSARDVILEKAKQMNLKIFDKKGYVESYAQDYGKECFQLLREDSEKHSVPVIFLSGGEPVVNVKGKGIGGRNQEVTGAFLSELCATEPILNGTFLSAGTDGIDGNSSYAGAIIDSFTCNKMKELKIQIREYQQNNDLTTFFKQIDQSLIYTGPTNTNVMDIQILLLNNHLLENKKDFK